MCADLAAHSEPFRQSGVIRFFLNVGHIFFQEKRCKGNLKQKRMLIKRK